MANLQSNFRKFNDTIKLGWDSDLEDLRTRRDRVLARLTAGLDRQRDAGAKIPTPEFRNQGSYAMRTGIKPLAGDYDIDVAVQFAFERGGRPAPVVVKEWVYEAVANHTARVEFRANCITVFYTEGGDPAYHVDLAVYSIVDGKVDLARGKRHSAQQSWDSSDPEEIVAVLDRFNDSDREQLRRIIRYLKRWKDECFSPEGEAGPRGIALTACAVKWFQRKQTRDPISAKSTDDDLMALLHVVESMLGNFGLDRLVVALPVPPGDDLFRRMNTNQMQNLRNQLTKLRDALRSARDDVSPKAASERLVGVMGGDFPLARDEGPSPARVLGTSGASA